MVPSILNRILSRFCDLRVRLQFNRLQSWAAHYWRRSIRSSVVVVGLFLFGMIQLGIASLVTQSAWFYLILFFAVGTAIALTFARPTLGFVYWLFLSPFARTLTRPFTSFQVTFDLVVLLLLIFVLVVRVAAYRPRLRRLRIAEWLLIASFIYAMVLRNIPAMSTNPYFSQLVLTPFVVYFVAKGVISKKEHVGWIMAAVMWVGVTWAAFGIYEHFAGKAWFSPIIGVDVKIQGEHDIGAGRSVGPAGHYYLYGNVIILSVLIALHRAGWAARPVSRVLYYLTCPVLLTGLYFGYSRAPYAAFIVALFSMLFLSRAGFKRYLAAAISALVVISLLAPVWLSDDVLRKRLEASPSARFAVNVTSMNMFRDNPWFGVGYKQYIDQVPLYVSSLEHSHYKPSPYTVIEYWGRPHSELFLVLSEQGIVGFTLYFGSMIAFLMVLFRVRSRLEPKGLLGKDFASLVIAFLLAVFLTMITDEFQAWPYMYFVIYTMFAAIVRLDELNETESKAAPLFAMHSKLQQKAYRV